MSRVRVAVRLALRDVRRRATETVLLFVALAVAATTLTIALVLHGQTGAPYAETRGRAAGPDVVALLMPAPDAGQPAHPTPGSGGGAAPTVDLARLRAVAARPEVAAASRVFPTTWVSIAAHGISGVAELQGRDAGRSPVDQPLVVSGTWLGRGPAGAHGVVVERAFAQAMGLQVGDRVTLDGTSRLVTGIAVSAALPPYPQLCTIGCILDRPSWFAAEPGLVWTDRADVARLGTRAQPLTWFQYFRLHDASSAPAFARLYGDDGPPNGRPQLNPWQDIASRQAEQLANERVVVVFGSTLLIILAMATLVVLVGGRMADEVRRVGLLKAAGATPGFVARLLLASYLAIGVVAALVGLVVGRLLAQTLVRLSAGLLGHAGGVVVTPRDGGIVVGVVIAVVGLAAAIPAWRASRTSTLRALGGSARAPRRPGLVVRLSSRLPAPAMLGVRLSVRRPRRALLTSLSVAVAVCGSVVVLYSQASLSAERGTAGGPADPLESQLHVVTTALTVLLAVMAAINLVFVTRAAATDARRVLTISRALGVTPGGAAVSLGLAQVLPAAVGLALGWLSGSALFHALSSSHPTTPSIGQLLALVVGTMLLTTVLTAVPAGWEARRPVAGVLREE